MRHMFMVLRKRLWGEVCLRVRRAPQCEKNVRKGLTGGRPVRLITVYSPSHEKLFYKYLRPTAHEFEVIAKQLPQLGNGEYMNSRWLEAMAMKVAFIRQQLRGMPGEVFVVADADVQMFPPVREYLVEQLGDYDIAFQDDVSSCCAGFLVARANKKVEQFYATLSKKIWNYKNEQTALNDLLCMVRWKKLPPTVFTIGLVNEGRVWQGEPLKIPGNIRVHHANFTVGLENKIKLLELVREAQSSLPAPCED